MRLNTMTNMMDFHTSFFYMLNTEASEDKLHEYMNDFFMDPPVISKKQKCGKSQLMDLMGKFNQIFIIMFLIYLHFFFFIFIYKTFYLFKHFETIVICYKFNKSLSTMRIRKIFQKTLQIFIFISFIMLYNRLFLVENNG